MSFPSVNGILACYKNSCCSVFVDENGKKKTSAKKIRQAKFLSVPILRGVIYFFVGAVFLIKTFALSLKHINSFSKLTQNVAQKLSVSKSSIAYFIASISSIILSFFLLGFLPSKLSFLLIGLSESLILRNFIIAITKVALIVIIFLVLRFLPQMEELYAFNGASNVIYRRLKKQNETKFSHHYPLNFLNFFVFAFILSSFVITLVGIRVNFWANWLINFAIFLLVLSLSYEILFLLTLNPRLEKLAILTSFLVCVKPKLTNLEVARALQAEILEKRPFKESDMEGKIPRSSLIAEMESELKKVDKVSKSDIDWIIATVLKKNRAEAKLVRFFDEKDYKEILMATKERAKGKPLSAIFGFVEFYGLKLNVNKKVLSPRMETEILVEEVIKEAKNIKKCNILDLGTGSGAIAISVAKNTDAKVVAVDISKSALEVAKENAKIHGVKIDFFQSDLFLGLKKRKKFDIIASNPPYIRTLDIEGLDEEVKNYDPRISLDGGEDGLSFYREIAKTAPKHLKKGGMIMFEIGYGQLKDVKKILENCGFKDIVAIKDYNKIYRVVKAVYGNSK